MNSPASGYRLGLDLGSISLNCVVLDPYGRMVFKRYERSRGRPRRTLRELLERMEAEIGAVCFAGAVATGSGKELVAGPTGIDTTNEILAHATGAWTICPQVRSVIEIGGQDSKFISVGRNADGTHFLQDHAFNELCAAGTGAFLDQQAERLGVGIEQFGAMAAGAGHVARMAGRCSVFAKSDMIHLQQKAVPADEIAAGLCYALARHYLAHLCRGRTPAVPVLFQGGVAANPGVVRAFRDLLNLSTPEELAVPENFDVMGALGAAVIAGGRPLQSPLALGEMIAALSASKAPAAEAADLEPLTRKPIALPPRAGGVGRAAGRLFMGIDVGSVSTKIVLVDAAHRLVAAAYLPTAGNPVAALGKAVGDLRRRVQSGVRIAHAAATGSGRHLARVLIGGGAVIDEISAQAAAAAFFFPDADTVIEIGGQDSKFIRLCRGTVERFRMNRACAAGTGAFLEEQAGRLGVDIARGFADAAFASPAPVRLGSRCTVFMDTDLVHHLQRGASPQDLCAGLAHAICRNYIEKVVGAEPVGARVVFQGGVARNTAVHAVFEKLLERDIRVHPHPEISGALGAAFTAIEELRAGESGRELRLEDLKIGGVGESFECRRCENRCEVRKITAGDGPCACFGGACGRFEESSSGPSTPDDAFSTRQRLLHAAVRSCPGAPTRGELGLPLTLTLSDHLPFWGTFFKTLGYAVRLSEATHRPMVEAGLRRAPAEFCHPIKLLFGHVQDLLERGTRRIFIPHLRLFAAPGEDTPWYACPYTQAAPYVVRENSDTEADILTLEYPVAGETARWVAAAAETLRIDRAEVRSAHAAALAAQDAFQARCREEGARLMEALKGGNRRGAVLIGRPYNTTDRHVNLQLARRLKKLGIEPVPLDFLPLERAPLPPLWERIRWGYGRKMVQAARVLKRHPHLGAVVVTNFGCGPDAFVDQYLEAELKEVPHLLIELDDHQAEAGIVTRIEAFARNFRTRSAPAPALRGKDPGKPRRPLRQYTYYVPAFMDHAYAITGALKASGCKTVLLPPTDEDSWNLGLRHAYGRECHPFIAFAGDMLKAARVPGFEPDKACFFGPSYFGPCLLPQYPLALHLILEKQGLGAVTVMNVTDPTNMRELGPAYMLRLATGLYAIDRLYKWKTEIEPYETAKGQVQSVYRRILADLEEGLAQGTFLGTLRRSTARLREVPLSQDAGSRPRIGIVGDVYTRVNAHSNDRLYQRLNQAGFEVWTSSSVIDVSFLAVEQRPAELARQGRPVQAAAAAALVPTLHAARRFVDRFFPERIRTPQERRFADVHRVSSRYASFWIDKVLSLNLNRIDELHRAGADGIINVMCHNCMLGTVTASLSKSIRRDIGDTPLCSLVYEGLKSTHNTNRLEAFAHQVRSFSQSRCRRDGER